MIIRRQYQVLKSLLHPQGLFDSIIQRLSNPSTMRSCKAGELAMTVWSVVAAGLASHYSDFLEAAAVPIMDKAESFSPREIGLVTWAYASYLGQERCLDSEEVRTRVVGDDDDA
jgi:hypothetical protein